VSPLFLLLLLGLSLAVVAFDSSDTDEDDEQVVDDEIIEGTDGPDTLTAGRDQTTNGLGGDDTLEAAGDNAKLNGGLGDDTLISIENDNVLIDGGEGDDKITFQPASQNGTDTGRALGGLGADTISVFGWGGNVDGGAGNDLINAQGSITGVSGGDGNDTITGDSADYGGGTPLSGDAGDDLLILSNSPSFQIGATADGGMGDDTIQSTTHLFSSDSYDTLTGGEGSDRFELEFTNAQFSNANEDVGVVTTITDFTPGVDVLVLPNSHEDAGGGLTLGQLTIEIVQAPDDSYTDVVFVAVSPEAAGKITGTIRLNGTTGLNASDILLVER
jgi:Ca2+-binding RTX toxin-like protein